MIIEKQISYTLRLKLEEMKTLYELAIKCLRETHSTESSFNLTPNQYTFLCGLVRKIEEENEIVAIQENQENLVGSESS